MTSFARFYLQSLVNKIGKIQRNSNPKPFIYFYFYSLLKKNKRKNQFRIWLDH